MVRNKTLNDKSDAIWLVEEAIKLQDSTRDQDYDHNNTIALFKGRLTPINEKDLSVWGLSKTRIRFAPIP